MGGEDQAAVQPAKQRYAQRLFQMPDLLATAPGVTESSSAALLKLK